MEHNWFEVPSTQASKLALLARRYGYHDPRHNCDFNFLAIPARETGLRGIDFARAAPFRISAYQRPATLAAGTSHFQLRRQADDQGFKVL